jgi:hypothetical protein
MLNIALASDEWLKASRYKEAEKFFLENCYDEEGELIEEEAEEVKEFIENLKNWDYDEFETMENNFDTSEL